MMNREQAIKEFIHNNTGLVRLVNIVKTLNRYDDVFAKYVWLDSEEFCKALERWNALEIIQHTARDFVCNADFYHITNEGKLMSASYIWLSGYFYEEKVRENVIAYLLECEHGHTGDEILDSIVNSTAGTMFDDSFYIYHAPEERPEDYDD